VKTLREVHERIERDIRKVGRSVMVVGGGKDTMPFAYTIGNSRGRFRGKPDELPELLVIGTTDAGFLNNLSQMMIDAEQAFADGQVVLIPGARLPVKVIRANNSAHSEYTRQASEHFGHDDYSVMQILMPDLDGVFPDDAGCKSPYSKVPVLR
jgi:hypothetical protein